MLTRPLIQRLFAIDRAIRNGGYPNASNLARELEVHRRTVYRDIDFLRDIRRMPVEFDAQHNGYCYRDPQYPLPSLHLSEAEFVALFLAERVLQAYSDAPFATELANALAKLTVGLSDSVTIDLNHLQQAYSIRWPGASAGDAERFRRLAKAVQQGRQLELVYWTASRDQTCRRVVDPYHLASVDGAWYLVGYCHLREDIRMFAPGRIRSLRETGEPCSRPADFQIQAFLDGTFRAVRGSGPLQRVRLRFSPEAGRYARERVWHTSQQLKELKDGRLELTFALDHLLEVRRWVLSWGVGCEVLEPEALRQEVRQEMERTLGMYVDTD